VNTCPLCKVRFRKIELRSGTPNTKKATGKTVRVRNVEQQEASYGPEDFAEEFYGDAQEYLEEEQAMQEAMDMNGVRFVGFGLANYDSELDESFSSSDVSQGEDEDIVLDSSSDSSDSSESASSSSFEVADSSVSSAPPSGAHPMAARRDESFRPESSSSSSSSEERVVVRRRLPVDNERYPLRTRRGGGGPPAPAQAPAPALATRSRRTRSDLENEVNAARVTRSKNKANDNDNDDDNDDDDVKEKRVTRRRRSEVELIVADSPVRPRTRGRRAAAPRVQQIKSKLSGSESDSSVFTPN
jgi:hypothetical protein